MTSRERRSTQDCLSDEDLTAFVEGALAGDRLDAARKHIEHCDDCRGVFDALTPDAGSPDAIDAIASGMLSLESNPPVEIAGRCVDRRYRLLRAIGAGGMGSVYEAEHIGTRRRVALKLINSLRANQAEARNRFRREARAAGAVRSPHIVEILDSGEDEATGDLYLVMELLKGEDLQTTIDRIGALAPAVALRIGAQALSGLKSAHAAGIVHRDIKPSNLFLVANDDGEVSVKLLDFGIAKLDADALHSAETAGLTASGGLLGSPLYMSPEQTQSSKDIGVRSDIWSLGSVLYCALSGAAPFGHIESVGKLILAICSTPVTPLQRSAPWVPSDVARVVHGAIFIDPEQRYPTAAAMLDAVTGVIGENDSVRANELVSLSPEARASVAPPGELETARTVPATQRRGGRLAIPAVAALALGLGVIAWIAQARTPATPVAAATVTTSAPTTADMASNAQLRVPADATIEIDGEPAEVHGGIVVIRGALGSGHRVRVTRGEDSAAVDVFITDKGALPPNVELPATSAARASVTAVPAIRKAPGAPPPASTSTPLAATSAPVVAPPPSRSAPLPIDEAVRN